MLKIQNICKNFYRNEAVKNVSFQLIPGEITGLLGPNGAGKTTLIRMINQIVLPDSGLFLLNEQPLLEKDVIKFGYLPEERGLYKNMTVQNHTLFISKIKGMNRIEAKKSLNFWLNKFEIQEWKNKKIHSLSKGMAQKIQFINTVIHNPEILILDEPFSGFDPINKKLIEYEIKRFKKEGKIIILSTHDMDSVESLCDKAIIINKGELIADSSVNELKVTNEEIYEIIFEGNLLGFTNALWTGYELINKKELGNNRNFVLLKMRNNNQINDLINTIMHVVKIESIRKKRPSMSEVFIQLTK